MTPPSGPAAGDPPAWQPASAEPVFVRDRTHSHLTEADERAMADPGSVQARWRAAVHRLLALPLWSHPAARVVTAVLAAALLLSRTPGRLSTLAMIVLSISASSRYMYWRLTDTVGFEHRIDALFGFGLVAAELYAFTVLLIGFFQTAWPLQRKPVPMPRDTAA
ncbi:MAG: Cellulose synthase catalytic subunit [UDP-forming] [Xylophilus sp.]|nr:MAG: Cellulose synthase catalytic subunit [UDP-forming] [Xylophilus sp.]